MIALDIKITDAKDAVEFVRRFEGILLGTVFTREVSFGSTAAKGTMFTFAVQTDPLVYRVSAELDAEGSKAFRSALEAGPKVTFCAGYLCFH